MDAQPEFIEVRMIVTARVERSRWDEEVGGPFTASDVVERFAESLALEVRAGFADSVDVQAADEDGTCATCGGSLDEDDEGTVTCPSGCERV